MSVVQSFPYGQSIIAGSAGADTTWTGLQTINEPCYTVYATLPEQMVPLAQATELLELDKLIPLAGDNYWLGQNTFANATSNADGLLPAQCVTKQQVDAAYAATGVVELGAANTWTATQLFPTMACTTLEDNAVEDETNFGTLTVQSVSVIPLLNLTSTTTFPHLFNDLNVLGGTIESGGDTVFPGLVSANEGGGNSRFTFTQVNGVYALPDNCPNPCTVIGDASGAMSITLPVDVMVGTIINLINPLNNILVRAPAGGILYNLSRNLYYTSSATANPNYFTQGGGIPLSVICVDATTNASRWLIFSIQT